jgi:hypothetical protein
VSIAREQKGLMPIVREKKGSRQTGLTPITKERQWRRADVGDERRVGLSGCRGSRKAQMHQKGYVTIEVRVI